MRIDEIRKLLRIFLKICAVIIFLYWGIIPTFFPAEYHAFLGVKEFNPDSSYDLFVANLVGALAIGFAYAAWLAADDPIKNMNLIRVLFVTGAAINFVYLYNLLYRKMSAINWVDALALSVLLLVLMAVYPWNEAQYLSRKMNY